MFPTSTSLLLRRNTSSVVALKLRQQLVSSSSVSLNKTFQQRANSTSGLPSERSFEYTTDMEIVKPETIPIREAFRMMDEKGKLLPGIEEPTIEKDVLEKMYTNMVQLQVMDGVLYEAQRQGRISFYMQTAGEEGVNIGSAAGLETKDVVFAQYREAGVLLWRGFTLGNFTDQCFSNIDDLGKGRQMPIHYGSNELNFHTISSPLTTQVPQAAGAAYSMKAEGNDGAIAVTYFGEGAASEGDFHAGMNFAATLECPMLFICRNNQYAISTPIEDQYRGDGIVSRAAGYGMASIRVDGNDVLAVHRAVSECRKYARENCKPVFIELMTYRIGHHSTSDDSTAYRPIEEIEEWRTSAHPIPRFRAFLEERKLWDEEKETKLRDEARKQVLKSMMASEEKDKPEVLSNLFKDVYDEVPPNLLEQKQELERMMKLYPKHYFIY